MIETMNKNKRIILTALIIFGLIVTIDLIHIYFKVNFGTDTSPSFCTINSLIDCDGVAKTKYSLIFGLPLAIWGTILYALLLFLTFVDKINEKLNIKLLNVFKKPSCYIATLGLFSFCCSMVLAGISIFEIQKICYLCFITYFIDLAIAIVAREDKFFIQDIKNTVLDFLDGVKKYFILFIIVCGLGIGFLTYMQKSEILVSESSKLQKSFEEFQNLKTNIYAIKGNTLGNPDGKIIIYVYSDFLCPFCKVTNSMIHKLAKEEKDIVVYHMNFPLDNECNPALSMKIHPGACMLAKYALAAERQGAYWDMVSAIYDNLPNSEEEILNLADKLQIDKNKLHNDAYSDDVQNDLMKQIEKAMNFGINGTPTIVIDEIEHKTALPYYQMKTFVHQARNRHRHEK